MAEGSYEYECMRAELLGVKKPDFEEFMKNAKKCVEVNYEECEDENLKECEKNEEQLNHVSGGFEELNNILQVTQRKINRLKASCGSFTSMLKFKLGASASPAVETTPSEETNNLVPQENCSRNEICDGSPKKSDLAKALDKHVDKLDTLIESAEKAHLSMSQQNKEIKRFLN